MVNTLGEFSISKKFFREDAVFKYLFTQNSSIIDTFLSNCISVPLNFEGVSFHFQNDET